MTDTETVTNSVRDPFTSNHDLVGVFLITGLVIVSAFAWMQILRPIANVVEDVVEGATS